MKVKYFEEYRCVYDDYEDLIEVYENDILTCRYKYNNNHQVIREDNLFLGQTITYEYNQKHKLIERSYYDYTLKGLQNAKHTDTFIYDNANRIIKYNDETFTYDKNGKPLTFRNAKLKFSKNNNLIQLDKFSYTYNKNHLKSCKINDNQKTLYYRNNKLKKLKGTSVMSFIYNHNDIVGFVLNDNNYFYKKNFNGDVVGILDNTHKLICKYVYDYFGNHIVNDKNKIAEENPFRFHNHYFDNETGLYYNNGTFYDSEITCSLNK